MRQSVFGASVQGASHIRSRTECQDSFKKTVCDDGTIIMAVADGHGSQACPFSKSGSNIAVNVFCKVMEEFHSGYADDLEKLLRYLNREGETKVAQSVDSEWKRRVLKAHSSRKREVSFSADGKKNREEIYRQYGSTLLGLMITPVFLFAFQLGDGDITYVDERGVDKLLESEKILGTETHSLSKVDSWKRAISLVRRRSMNDIVPAVFILSTDGFSNSYKNEHEFERTCVDYFSMIVQHGAEAVDANLKHWLSETSEMGCGDDITLLIAYFASEQIDDESVSITASNLAVKKAEQEGNPNG